MADRLHVAILGITHQPKSTGTAAMHRFIGSIAFIAAAQAAYMVTRDPEDDSRRLFLPVKNNLAPRGQGLAFRLEQRIVAEPGIVASSVLWEDTPVTITADQALAATDAARHGTASPLAEAVEYLDDKLSAGPVAVQDVDEHARALGIALRTLRRARKTLGVRAVKDGFDRGCCSNCRTKSAKTDRRVPLRKVAAFGKIGRLRRCPGEVLRAQHGRICAAGR